MKERTERSQISEEECSTLLIADDSEINRRLMYYMFAPFYPVEQAENGRVALEKISVMSAEILCSTSGCADAGIKRDGSSSQTEAGGASG